MLSPSSRTSRPVDPQAAELQALWRRIGHGCLRCLSLLAELDPQPGQQHRGRRCLEDVVVGSQLQTQDLVHVAVEGGEHDDGALEAWPQIPAQGETILPRQHDVEQHQVWLLGFDSGKCHVASGLQQYFDVVAGKPAADELAYFGIIFNKKNALHCGVTPWQWRGCAPASIPAPRVACTGITNQTGPLGPVVTPVVETRRISLSCASGRPRLPCDGSRGTGQTGRSGRFRGSRPAPPCWPAVSPGCRRCRGCCRTPAPV